jgi:hypothetical protein
VDDVLTRSAAHAGFALHLSSSNKQGYFRYHYSKGTKIKKDLQVGMCPCYYRLIRLGDLSYKFGKFHVTQNYQLIPSAFAEIVLSDEIRDYIRELHHVKISPMKIQFALQAKGMSLSKVQIYNICRPGHLAEFGSISVELIRYMESEQALAVDHRERTESSHASDCFWHVVLTARLANTGSERIGAQEKCRTCHGFGHQPRKCPCPATVRDLILSDENELEIT